MEDRSLIIEKMAERCVGDESLFEDQANSFKTAAMIREQRKREVVEYLESEALQKALLRAVNLLLSPESERVLSDEEMEDLQENLAKITADKLLNPSDEIKELIDKNQEEVIPYQQIFGLSNDSLLTIYKLGYHYFQNQNIDEAIDIFILLTTLNSTVADFYYALGLCYQQKQQWPDAVACFTFASYLNPAHVGARISLIECYQQLKDDTKASVYIDEVSRLQEECPEKVEPWLEIFQSLKNQ